jgi:hypothetical protein
MSSDFGYNAAPTRHYRKPAAVLMPLWLCIYDQVSDNVERDSKTGNQDQRECAHNVATGLTTEVQHPPVLVITPIETATTMSIKPNMFQR